MQLSQGVRGAGPHPHYIVIGEQNEVEHSKTLSKYEREKPFKRQLDNVVLSGRVDFLLPDSINECKATFDKSKFTRAEQGHPDPVHLAQLVCYLLEFNLRRGRLIYGWFQVKPDNTFHRSKVAELAVTIDGNTVLVDGADTGHKTDDVVNSIVRQSKYLQSDLPAPRPSTATSFKSPCKYCPLKTLCDRIDNDNLTVSQCRDEAKQLIVSAPQGPAPRPTKYKEAT